MEVDENNSRKSFYNISNNRLVANEKNNLFLDQKIFLKYIFELD